VTNLVQAGPAYAQTLASLHKTAFPHDSWDVKTFATLLTQPGVTAWLDERGGFLLLRIAADEAEILTLGVSLQRHGIATTLLQTAIGHATQAAATALFLEVATSNHPARALYEKHGFRQTGRRKSYYTTGEDALILTLPLTTSYNIPNP
jgi:ribosomal-protein-alanine N-acetyltransferase